MPPSWDSSNDLSKFFLGIWKLQTIECFLWLQVYEDDGTLNTKAATYTDKSALLVQNHCLSIMVTIRISLEQIRNWLDIITS